MCIAAPCAACAASATASDIVGCAWIAWIISSTVEELIRTIHAHPTMSEAVAEAAHAAHGAAIHL